jgi:GMP synthase-like glutamine amidotransferase
MRIHFLQNSSSCTGGNIEEWIKKNKCTSQISTLFNGDDFPGIHTFDLLFILGGNPEKCPWLHREIEFIQKAILENKYVIGSCLGSQLIAEAMGGKLIPHTHTEIGWLPVLITNASDNLLLQHIPREFSAFFFHKNTFILPDKFILCGESVSCKNQIYVYKNRVIGFQFHPEITKNILCKFRDNAWKSDKNGVYIQMPSQWFEQEYLDKTKIFMHTILDNMKKIFVQKHI